MYDPNGKFDGLTDFEQAIDGFTTITDEHGATATTTATISIQGKNDPPVRGDRAVTDQDSAVVSVPINDPDPDAGGNLEGASIDTAQTRGSVRMNADGSLTYDPGRVRRLRPGETATVTFTYVVDDFVGARSTGVVTVTVVASSPAVLRRNWSNRSRSGRCRTSPGDSCRRAMLASARVDGCFPAGQVAFRPTHLATMLLASQRYSRDTEIGALACPTRSPLAAFRWCTFQRSGRFFPEHRRGQRIAIARPPDLVGGRITLSFDWNFVTAEAQPELTSFE